MTTKEQRRRTVQKVVAVLISNEAATNQWRRRLFFYLKNDYGRRVKAVVSESAEWSASVTSGRWVWRIKKRLTIGFVHCKSNGRPKSNEQVAAVIHKLADLNMLNGRSSRAVP
jgi:hypothetical protein